VETCGAVRGSAGGVGGAVGCTISETGTTDVAGKFSTCILRVFFLEQFKYL